MDVAKQEPYRRWPGAIRALVWCAWVLGLLLASPGSPASSRYPGVPEAQASAVHFDEVSPFAFRGAWATTDAELPLGSEDRLASSQDFGGSTLDGPPQDGGGSEDSSDEAAFVAPLRIDAASRPLQTLRWTSLAWASGRGRELPAARAPPRG
jgi:hypothetical protein